MDTRAKVKVICPKCNSSSVAYYSSFSRDQILTTWSFDCDHCDFKKHGRFNFIESLIIPAAIMTSFISYIMLIQKLDRLSQPVFAACFIGGFFISIWFGIFVSWLYIKWRLCICIEKE